MGFKNTSTFQKGDLLRTRRDAGYYHYGIASSESTVIHYSGLEGDNVLNPNNIKIIETPVEQFIREDFLQVLTPFKSPFEREEIVKRAKNCVGNSKFNGKFYNLVSNNCEHFARYCYSGKRRSHQVSIVVGSSAGALLSPMYFHGSLITLLSKNIVHKIKKRRAKKK